MSISTPQGGGGSNRPASTKPGGKPKDSPIAATPKKAGAAPKKAGVPNRSSGPGAKKTPGKKAGGGGPRKPITPVKVNQGRNWGPIALFGFVGLIAVAIIGFGAFQVFQNGQSWQDRAGKISGLKDYRKDDPKLLDYQSHQNGPITYKVNPPVGGTHNPNWQRCLGDVYPEPIASEHAVHSEEHGAVWITYNPSKVSKADIETLAKKVRGHDFTLMSPFPSLDKPISLQTWGYQLKVDKASDPRIDQFIKALREVSAKEQQTTCSAGSFITETGTTPHDLDPQSGQNQQQGGVPGQGG
jgi:hypothetical protein